MSTNTQPTITVTNIPASNNIAADTANAARNIAGFDGGTSFNIAAAVGGAIIGQETKATFTKTNVNLEFNPNSNTNSSALTLSYPKNNPSGNHFDFLRIQITKFVPITRATSVNLRSEAAANAANQVLANEGANSPFNIGNAFRSAGITTTINSFSPIVGTALNLRDINLGNALNQTIANNNAATAAANTGGTDFTLGSIQTDNSREVLANIMLPMPDAIVFSDGMSYSDSSGGAVGRLVPRMLRNGDVTNDIQTLANLGADQFLNAVLQKNAAFLIGSTEQFTQGLSGQILNPFIEQVFKGVEPREFSFNWNLVPRNVEEQIEIQQLILTLRKFALPDYSKDIAGDNSGALNQLFTETFNNTTGNVTDRWLTVPDIFTLKFYHYSGTEIQYLQKFKPAVCTAISVNYTGDNAWIYHQTTDDGTASHAPVAYKLSLTFKETEILSRRDVQNGF